jgi:XamI restriction endonuclease
MVEPPRWSSSELAAEAGVSASLFRAERLGEPLSKWLEEYDARAAEFERLFQSHGIAHPATMSPQDIAAIFEAGLGDALRYLAGPPVSADDLKTLAEVRSFSPSRLRAKNCAGAGNLLEVLRATVDPRRFPWIAAGRDPTPDEIKTAIAASAALIAGQRVQTDRRSAGKNAQESAVKAFLRSIGFSEEPARKINTLDDAPPRGAFCAESLVGSRKADVPIRLFDGRLLPIECKVSNSALNSIKRINNDAAVKASIWHKEFGINQVVPSAMLSGVFDVANLVKAQNGDLTLFWAHRFSDLGDFIEATRA